MAPFIRPALFLTLIYTLHSVNSECLDNLQEFDGLVLDKSVHAVVSQKRLRTPESCYAFCCNLGEDSCTSVTFELPPSYWCYTFNCKSEDECRPLVAQASAQSAFVNLPMTTTTTISTTPMSTTSANTTTMMTTIETTLTTPEPTSPTFETTLETTSVPDTTISSTPMITSTSVPDTTVLSTTMIPSTSVADTTIPSTTMATSTPVLDTTIPSTTLITSTPQPDTTSSSATMSASTTPMETSTTSMTTSEPVKTTIDVTKTSTHESGTSSTQQTTHLTTVSVINSTSTIEQRQTTYMGTTNGVTKLPISTETGPNVPSDRPILTNSTGCPSSTPNFLPTEHCDSNHRIEYHGFELNNECMKPIFVKRLRDWLSCWAYCCFYEVEGCTSVSFRQPPDWRCFMYDCRSEEECPVLVNPEASVGFMKLPWTTTATPETTIEMRSARPLPTQPATTEATNNQVHKKVCDADLNDKYETRVMEEEIGEHPIEQSSTMQNVTNYLSCFIACCYDKNGCTAATWSPAAQTCDLYQCSDPDHCNMTSVDYNAVSWIAYERLPNETTTTMLTETTSAVTNHTEVTMNTTTASNFTTGTEYTISTANLSTPTVPTTLHPATTTEQTSAMESPLTVLTTTAIASTAMSPMQNDSGGKCPKMTVDTIKGVMSNYNNAKPDERCFMNSSASTKGMAIDNQCAFSIGSARLLDILGCWAFCCYFADAKCTHISYDSGTKDCKLYFCPNNDVCRMIPSELSTTTQLRSNIDKVISPEVIDKQSDRYKKGDMTGTDLQKDSPQSCMIPDGGFRSNKTVDRRNSFTLKEQRVNDMLACSLLCCNSKGCTVAVFHGQPEYTCTLHRCMGGQCPLIPAQPGDTPVWSIQLDKDKGQGVQGIRRVHAVKEHKEPVGRDQPSLGYSFNDNGPQKFPQKQNDLRYLDQPQRSPAVAGDWVKLNKHIANVNYLYNNRG